MVVIEEDCEQIRVLPKCGGGSWAASNRESGVLLAADVRVLNDIPDYSFPSQKWSTHSATTQSCSADADGWEAPPEAVCSSVGGSVAMVADW